MTALMRDCTACGAWTCGSCGWKRQRARPLAIHGCAKCGSTTGTFRPSRHGDRVWRDHNPWPSWPTSPTESRS